MRKVRLFALMTACLLLTSCSAADRTEKTLQEIRTDVASAEHIRLSATITSDYGDRVYDHGIVFDGTSADGTITVTAPECIAGVSVRIADGATELNYDNVQIYTGEILPDGISPVDSVPVMLTAWSDGLITESVRESFNGEDCIAALFRISDDVNMKTWFSTASLLPLRTEFYFNGYTVLFLDFYNVSME